MGRKAKDSAVARQSTLLSFLPLSCEQTPASTAAPGTPIEHYSHDKVVSSQPTPHMPRYSGAHTSQPDSGPVTPPYEQRNGAGGLAQTQGSFVLSDHGDSDEDSEILVLDRFADEIPEEMGLSPDGGASKTPKRDPAESESIRQAENEVLLSMFPSLNRKKHGSNRKSGKRKLPWPQPTKSKAKPSKSAPPPPDDLDELFGASAHAKAPVQKAGLAHSAKNNTAKEAKDSKSKKQPAKPKQWTKPKLQDGSQCPNCDAVVNDYHDCYVYHSTQYSLAVVGDQLDYAAEGGVAPHATSWKVWGHGTCGECGTGERSNQAQPIPLDRLWLPNRMSPGKISFVSLAFGTHHVAASCGDGSLFTWGRGEGGRLGHDDTGNRFLPCRVAPLQPSWKFRMVSCGKTWTAAVTDCGNIQVLGGPVMRHANGTIRRSIEGLLPEDPIRKLSCGDSHCIAISEKARCYAFGSNSHGQLGCDTLVSDPFRLVAVSGALKLVLRVSACGDGSAAVTARGELHTWGSGIGYRLGHGTMDNAGEPQQVSNPTLNGVALLINDVSLGETHMSVLTRCGRVYCCGDNSRGQAGTKDAQKVTFLKRVEGDIAQRRIVSLFSGSRHNLAVAEEGDVFAWGDNNFGQCGSRELFHDYQPVPRLMHGAGRDNDLHRKITKVACGDTTSAICLGKPLLRMSVPVVVAKEEKEEEEQVSAEHKKFLEAWSRVDKVEKEEAKPLIAAQPVHQSNKDSFFPLFGKNKPQSIDDRMAKAERELEALQRKKNAMVANSVQWARGNPNHFSA